MAEELYTREWRATHADSSFPFTEASALVNDSDRAIPRGTFLDAIVFATAPVGAVYLAEVEVSQAFAVVRFRDGQRSLMAQGSVSIPIPSDDVPLFDIHGRDAGILVSESARLAVFGTWGLGLHELPPDRAELVPAAVVAMPAAGVDGFLLDDGTIVPGHVHLVGGPGVVVRPETVVRRRACGSETATGVRVDIVGDPLFRNRLCSGLATFIRASPIRTIRFKAGDAAVEVTPDAYGNVSILINNEDAPSTVLRLAAADGELRFGVAGASQP